MLMGFPLLNTPIPFIPPTRTSSPFTATGLEASGHAYIGSGGDQAIHQTSLVIHTDVQLYAQLPLLPLPVLVLKSSSPCSSSQQAPIIAPS